MRRLNAGPGVVERAKDLGRARECQSARALGYLRFGGARCCELAAAMDACVCVDMLLGSQVAFCLGTSRVDVRRGMVM